jgi:hypothetical protein
LVLYLARLLDLRHPFLIPPASNMGALVRTVTPVSNTMAATVTSLLAKQLQHDPSATYAILPGQDDDVEPVKVSFQDFALATRRFARLIQPTTKTSGAGPIPGSSKTGVIGLLIHCDTLLYATALSGVIAAGYTVRSSSTFTKCSSDDESHFSFCRFFLYLLATLLSP